MEKTRIIRIVTSTEAQNKFGEMLKRAYANAEHVIIEKSGIPVAAIIPVADYQERFSEPKASAALEETLSAASRRELASRQLREVLDRVHAQMPDVSEEEVDRDIAEAVRAVRKTKAKRQATGAKQTRTAPSRRPSRHRR
jgi:prevent-host-death family protein